MEFQHFEGKYHGIGGLASACCLCNPCDMEKKQPEGEPQGKFAEVKRKAAEQRAMKNRQSRENAEKLAAKIAKENQDRGP